MNQIFLTITVLINFVLISQMAAAPHNLQSNGAVTQQVVAPFSDVISVPKSIVKREFLPPPLFEVEEVDRHRGGEQHLKEETEDKEVHNDGERNNDHDEDDDDDSDLAFLG